MKRSGECILHVEQLQSFECKARRHREINFRLISVAFIIKKASAHVRRRNERQFAKELNLLLAIMRINLWPQKASVHWMSRAIIVHRIGIIISMDAEEKKFICKVKTNEMWKWNLRWLHLWDCWLWAIRRHVSSRLIFLFICVSLRHFLIVA